MADVNNWPNTLDATNWPIVRGPEVDTHFGIAPLWFECKGGERWAFHRTAIQKDGNFSLEQLQAGELLLSPGVIYRKGGEA